MTEWDLAYMRRRVQPTDADIDRIADAVPIDPLGVHITTWHRRFARAVLAAQPAPVPKPGPVAWGALSADGKIYIVWHERTHACTIPLYTHPAAPVPVPLTQAATDVLAERKRQVEVEGWTPDHDDAHKAGGMAVAAACYAAWSLPSRPASETVAVLWPWTGWAQKWFKPKDTRRNLIRAAALLLAEIERLDRARIAASPEKKP